MRMSARDERLTSFLLARIAEDEAAAHAAEVMAQGVDTISTHSLPEFAEHMTRWQPARVLAECAAKREIVADFRRWELLARGGDMSALGTASGARVACLRLVAVYKDHPDFDEVWLP